MNVKARLFGRPKWELVRCIEGGRLERRLVRGSVCLKCGKKKAFMYRAVAADGSTVTDLMIFGTALCAIYFDGIWCSEDHMATGNGIDRITAGLKKSTAD